MKTQVENSFLRRICEKFKMIREEFKKDSVASNLRKPVDCCNPPVPPKGKDK